LELGRGYRAVRPVSVRYDLKLIHDLCAEVGFCCHIRSEDRVEIELGKDAKLIFMNSVRDEDCLVCFEGTPWHAHDDIMFADNHGHYIEVDYLNLVTGLKDGLILICESWIEEKLADRWLIHRDYNDEFRFLRKSEEIRVYSIHSA
jgi:hypothetical protein